MSRNERDPRKKKGVDWENIFNQNSSPNGSEDEKIKREKLNRDVLKKLNLTLALSIASMSVFVVKEGQSNIYSMGVGVVALYNALQGWNLEIKYRKLGKEIEKEK